jgi:hypothetical protein
LARDQPKRWSLRLRCQPNQVDRVWDEVLRAHPLRSRNNAFEQPLYGPSVVGMPQVGGRTAVSEPIPVSWTVRQIPSLPGLSKGADCGWPHKSRTGHDPQTPRAFAQDLSASLSPAIRAPAGNCSTCCRFCLPCWAGPGPGCNRPHAVAPPNTTTTRHSGLRAMLVCAADGVATLSNVGADAGRAGPRRSTGGRQLQQLGRCLGGGQDETAKVPVSGVSRSDVPTYTR